MDVSNHYRSHVVGRCQCNVLSGQRDQYSALACPPVDPLTKAIYVFLSDVLRDLGGCYQQAKL